MYFQYVCMFAFYPFNKDSCCLETSFVKGLIHMIKSYDLKSIVFVIDLTKFTLESQSQWFNLKKFFLI